MAADTIYISQVGNCMHPYNITEKVNNVIEIDKSHLKSKKKKIQ